MFQKKEWKNRISEYPTRRILTDEAGIESLVSVARSEGTISQEGDAFSAENMNGLENRILAGFQSLTADGTISEVKIVTALPSNPNEQTLYLIK